MDSVTILHPTGPTSYEVRDEFGDPIGFVESFVSVIDGRSVGLWWAHLRRIGRVPTNTRGSLPSLDDAVRAVIEMAAEESAARAADQAVRDEFWHRVNPEWH